MWLKTCQWVTLWRCRRGKIEGNISPPQSSCAGQAPVVSFELQAVLADAVQEKNTQHIECISLSVGSFMLYLCYSPIMHLLFALALLQCGDLSVPVGFGHPTLLLLLLHLLHQTHLATATIATVSSFQYWISWRTQAIQINKTDQSVDLFALATILLI